MKPIESVQEAITLLGRYTGAPEDFLLPISDSLLDPAGINMAIITDKVLALGWEPNGFTQNQGFRVYRYKEMQ